MSEKSSSPTQWIQRRSDPSPEDQWVAERSTYPSCKRRTVSFGEHFYYLSEECRSNKPTGSKDKAMTSVPVTGQFGPPLFSVLSKKGVVVDAKWSPPKRRRPGPAGYLAAVGALFLCVAQVSSARGDSASCIAKVSAYVAELDALLSKERNWITPYHDLNERYFPFRDCEADALLDAVRRSSFIRSISYFSGRYFIHFSSDEVLVGFTYYVLEKNRVPRPILLDGSTSSGFTKCLKKSS